MSSGEPHAHIDKNVINTSSSDMSSEFGRSYFLPDIPEERGKCINTM